MMPLSKSELWLRFYILAWEHVTPVTTLDAIQDLADAATAAFAARWPLVWQKLPD
jgi:hypothetical protein